MGKSITPKYRVEYSTNRGSHSMMAWRGRVSQERLEQWRKDYNHSFQPGQINGQYAPGATVIHINYARIVRQSDGQLMTETTMPMFEVA